jgi:hypothetical protein
MIQSIAVMTIASTAIALCVSVVMSMTISGGD